MLQAIWKGPQGLFVLKSPPFDINEALANRETQIADLYQTG